MSWVCPDMLDGVLLECPVAGCEHLVAWLQVMPGCVFGGEAVSVMVEAGDRVEQVTVGCPVVAPSGDASDGVAARSGVSVGSFGVGVVGGVFCEWVVEEELVLFADQVHCWGVHGVGHRGSMLPVCWLVPAVVAAGEVGGVAVWAE